MAVSYLRILQGPQPSTISFGFAAWTRYGSLSPVHTGDKVEKTFDIWATKITNFWRSWPNWTRSTLATMSTATQSTKSNELATVDFRQTGDKVERIGDKFKSRLSRRFWWPSTLLPVCTGALQYSIRLVVVFNYLLVTQCYTEDSCRPAIIDSRQKQRSQISFHALSFQKI